MNDYISRKEAIEKIKEEGILGDGYSDTERENDVIKMLNYISAADVQPIKFGKWEMAFGTHRPNRAICSCCNWSTDEYGAKSYNFCPNCGADMRGEQ